MFLLSPYTNFCLFQACMERRVYRLGIIVTSIITSSAVILPSSLEVTPVSEETRSCMPIFGAKCSVIVLVGVVKLQTGTGC